MTLSGGAPGALALDAAGNLYAANVGGGSVEVLPKASGTLFGKPVTADTLTTIASGLFEPFGIAFYHSGNMYISDELDNGQVAVLPEASGSLFGVPVTAGVLTTLVSSGVKFPVGLAVDAAGNLYIANGGNEELSVLPKVSGQLFGKPVTANHLTTWCPASPAHMASHSIRPAICT